MTAAADHPAQVYRLALNALDTADLPMVQNDAGQVALLMGIVSACSEWITTSAKQGDPVALIAADAGVPPETAKAVLLGFADFIDGQTGAVVVSEISLN